MIKWFETQEDYCFYGCSVLLTYEGTATSASDLNVSAKLIDFAHSFDGQGKKVNQPRHQYHKAAKTYNASCSSEQSPSHTG
eukprot:scaffold663900_cov47-Prasinocladus_malaysianus.AAC.1